MYTLTIRLTEELERELKEEARLSRRPRAELAEKAILSFLEERRQERFREALAHAADALGRDRETLDFAEEHLPLDNEALGLVEDSAPDNLESPSWHEDILRERRQRLAAGETSFLDWEQAKADIRRRAS